MDLLKRENWWVWLVLTLVGNGLISTIILSIFLKTIDRNQWYANWWVWIIGALFLLFPVFIMLIIFSVQLQVNNASKLDVPGKEIYYNPYFWVLGVIIPFVGWLAIIMMNFYLSIMIIVNLYNGNGEKYIVK